MALAIDGNTTSAEPAMSISGSTRRQRLRILREAPLWFLILLIIGFILLFQFNPFHSRLDLSNGSSSILVAQSSEVVFYGDAPSCSVYSSGSGVYEKPHFFEVPRFIEGSWRSPRVTVYNRYGAGWGIDTDSNQPAAYASVSCVDRNSNVWVSGLDSPWPFFTQNRSMSTRYIMAAGVFFFAALVLPFALFDVRYVLTGKKSKRFSL